MKQIEKPTYYVTKFLAEDNTEWDTEEQCRQYESLLKDNSPLKALCFYDREGKLINIFELKEIPPFCYLVLNQDIEQYNKKVISYIVLGHTHGDCSYRLPYKKGIWYNNWSNAYSGGNGSNGWEKQATIKELEENIKNYQKRLELFIKITNQTIDK